MLRGIVAAASWLALPLSLLLFVQWPLREIVHAYSREANDAAQVLFALYVGIAITAATRHHAHLAADAFARRYSGRVRDVLSRTAALAIVMPWALFVLYAALPGTIASVVAAERFPDTYNPGYWLLRVALVLLALVALGQALVDVFRHPGSTR